MDILEKHHPEILKGFDFDFDKKPDFDQKPPELPF
jgi:hypothetical protein